MLSFVVSAILALPPRPAIQLAAAVVGEDPEHMLRIYRRECPPLTCGLHKVDVRPPGWTAEEGTRAAWRVGLRAWRKAVEVGWLDPIGCAEHALANPMRWSTSGAGLIRAYHLRLLGPLSCVRPSTIDRPIVMAFLVARKLAAARRPGAHPSTRSWAGLTRARR